MDAVLEMTKKKYGCAVIIDSQKKIKGIITDGDLRRAIKKLDISDKTPKVLYYLDAAGGSQGVEFTPEGDKLFLGSPAHGRIEVYDVVGDFELVKNQKFLKIGYGHNSLTIGKKYQP